MSRPRSPLSDRCPPPVHEPPCRSGGLISTGPGPSSTSLKARLRTPTTTKSSHPRCARLPTTTCWSSSQPARSVNTLPPLPVNARAATYLPYDELLPRTSVFVTNGGYGGVQHALRYGVPIVATGGKEDKPEVGARIAWSGVGRRIRSERPTPRALRRDILAVLNQPRYRQASSSCCDRHGCRPRLRRLGRHRRSACRQPQPHPIGGRQHQFGAGRLINSRLCADPASDH